MTRTLLSSLILALSFAVAIAQDPGPPAGFGKIDQVIRVNTVPGKMIFDVSTLFVRPGSKIKLTLVNEDDMQHNLVICRPGKEVFMNVAQAAWALGADAIKKQFVPDHPDVLFYTPLVDPHQRGAVYFQAPQEEGDYPFVCTLPGHAMLMNGIMKVSETAKAPELLRDMSYTLYRGTFRDMAALEGVTPNESNKLGKLFSLAPVKRPGDFAILFKATLALAESAEYTFTLAAGGTAELLIDGKSILSAQLQEQTAKVNLAAGDHPVELRYFASGDRRELDVTLTGGGLSRTLLSGPVPKLRVISAQEGPKVVRVILPETSPIALAVGQPSGIHYAFDVQNGLVPYVWRGLFLDVFPNVDGRGGKPCEPLGDRVRLGAVDFPLRIGENPTPEVKFLGYRMTSAPEILYSVEGVEVVQTVTPEGPEGVNLTFTLKEPKEPVTFRFKSEGLKFSASTGTWGSEQDPRDRAKHLSVLTVPVAEAAHFTVTLQPTPTAPPAPHAHHTHHHP